MNYIYENNKCKDKKSIQSNPELAFYRDGKVLKALNNEC